LKKASLVRWALFILLQCLIIAIVINVTYKHKDKVSMVKLPPTSLAQWYKPENKRQVWLHNMFKLRREMQAVQYYAGNHADSSNEDLLNKWTSRLSEHYLKIGEMVPEWQDKLNTESMDVLQALVKNKQFKEVSGVLADLTESCDACHIDYRATTATLYRAPDFSKIEISPLVPLETYMDKLTRQVNQIKIASEDGMTDVALSSLSELKAGINVLGETCSNCHKHDPRTYPDETINSTLTQLEESLKTGTLKDQGRELGTLAVIACARCHGTHRISYDARKQLSDEPDWHQLMKH
jgi:hypothetical protein